MNNQTPQSAEACYDHDSVDAADLREWGIADEEPTGVPVAWKYADPTEDARWIYDAAEADEIAREDSGLIVYV